MHLASLNKSVSRPANLLTLKATFSSPSYILSIWKNFREQQSAEFKERQRTLLSCSVYHVSAKSESGGICYRFQLWEVS